jgi:hypothetical protein
MTGFPSHERLAYAAMASYPSFCGEEFCAGGVLLAELPLAKLLKHAIGQLLTPSKTPRLGKSRSVFE